MSTRRNGDLLTIRDHEGDGVSFVRIRSGGDAYPVVIAASGQGAGVTREDCAELLTFLVAALDLEASVPWLDLADLLDPACEACNVKRSAHDPEAHLFRARRL